MLILKVKELIQHLKGLDQDKEIGIFVEEWQKTLNISYIQEINNYYSIKTNG